MRSERGEAASAYFARNAERWDQIRSLYVSDADVEGAILEAEGKREAAFRDAEARERLAEAEAKATQLVSDAISAGDVQAINYFVAQKYVEALGQFANSPNQKLMILPTEVTGVMGSIAGIAELAKAGLERTAPDKTK